MLTTGFQALSRLSRAKACGHRPCSLNPLVLTYRQAPMNAYAMSESIFSPALFRFLNELRTNNNREWFETNRERYETEMLEPALEFIEAFAPHLRRISPNFVASTRRVGGSMFRIHRDIRFSKDKSPYKTHLGIRFPHNDKEVHGPGFYLHVEPRESFVAAGIWHPDSTTLTKIRDAIVDDPSRWKRAAHGKRFTDAYQLSGDTLKRPPTGYDRDHPLVDDLKRKDFIGVAPLSDKAVTSDDLLPSLAGTCRHAEPFVHFLCDAVGVSF
jgi:uncharacterized protein (TIGR02453 family)